ncbi:hypothetical protein QO010_002627 [Caulobacter ginsengisoli]|uniref:DUF3142 domain-containing protein n=1 Tax=Caulobacter ginsengisoli TaxID=400775 RepID=A0ABU0IS57_9CAUL|nr:hypothetical protein [Caulobacter ginsengisoli]MDQ0464843.1 hypothetical protein [Caulobacter ginsengisoli]
MVAAPRLLSLVLAGALTLGLSGAASPADPRRAALVLWAWDRPEDLRFAQPGDEVAAVVGVITLSGEAVVARGRTVALKLPPGVRRTAVVHVEIDPHNPAAWTPRQRAAAAAAVLAYSDLGWEAAQVDFEVRASQRPILLDLLTDVRAGLPSGQRLSMTALASWCDTEQWMSQAPVDEVVPMLFRMGPGGQGLRRRLEAGGDLREPRCRAAMGMAVDQPLSRLPPGRRLYLFNPRPWSQPALDETRARIAAWRN